MLLKDFDFLLPDDLIAHTPPPERSDSRLMILQRGEDHPPQHLHFSSLLDFLSQGDLLVMNDTRVFPARLRVQKPTGGAIELLFLHPSRNDKTPKDLQVWHVMARPAKSMRSGLSLCLPGGHTAEVLGYSQRGERLLGFSAELDLFAYLERYGEIPLPPYIRPDGAAIDHRERYQTVYARQTGAVAAPTAGLHLTAPLLAALETKGIGLAWVTLHVGAGTFLPVRTERIEEHTMHKEWFQISERTATQVQQARRKGGRIIAVGTTSLRALEAAARGTPDFQAQTGETDIFIYPGYTFRIVDGLVTNFHLPCSTLLMLVSAFHGRERLLAAYHEAIRERYRFYSYGDAMLILPSFPRPLLERKLSTSEDEPKTR